MPLQIVVVLAYLLVTAIVYFAIIIYMPILIKQIAKMSHSLMKFYQSNNMGWLIQYLNHYVNDSETTTQAEYGTTILAHALTNVGILTIAFFMPLITNFLYTIELDSMNEFSHTLLNNHHLSWLSKDIAYFGNKSANTLGVVLEAQSFIALCNIAMTMTCLIIMKMPQVIVLGLMVFILSLILVAGVIISLIPLSFVVYSVDGVRHIIYILIVIMIIHVVEAYILNPKFMSNKTGLLISYTFVVLLVGEHFLGTWGLAVGALIFTFLLDTLGVKLAEKKKPTTLKIGNKK